MAQGTTFIGWLAAGSGVILIYAAYKNKSPMDVVTASLSGTKTEAKPINTPSTGTFTVGDKTPIGASVSDGSREAKIANRTLQPTLTPIPTQPNLVMDIAAVTSFMLVQAQFGRPVFLGNTYRSYKQQADAYAKDPDHFAPPGHSLHEVGLALDIDTNKVYYDDPKLVKAFEDHGWLRKGKVIEGRNEVWHWSYKIAG